MESNLSVQSTGQPQENQGTYHSEGSRSTTVDSYCLHCSNLSRKIFNERNRNTSFKFMVSDVVTNDIINCPYCKFLIDAIEAWDIIPRIVNLWIAWTTQGLLLRGDDNGTKHQLEFYVSDSANRSRILPSSIPTAKHVVPIWSDPAEVEKLKSYLTNDAPIPTKLPTRVLDLGVGTGDVDTIRIHKNGEHGEHALYAALSHCWALADIKSTKTTTDNIEARMKALSCSGLPATFKQAFTVCRRMGVRYLWIDSLCILQDDAADWKREAAAMDKVYTNAWFTITMHGSIYGGIPWKDVRLQVGSDSTSVHVRYIPTMEEIAENQAFAPDVGEVDELADNVHWKAVAQRGWCYQERALSTRMIHFTRHEYLYEERGRITECQCGRHTGFGTKLGYAGALKKRVVREDWTYRDWNSLVQQYTQRMFGYRSDLLPGFAGIATQFGKRHDLGPYVAGLWTNDLIRWLCWRSREWVSARASSWPCLDCRPHPERIWWTRDAPTPSFSWASRFGPCEFVFESWKLDSWVEVAKIERVECLMDEVDPHLRVRPLISDKLANDPCARYIRIKGSLYACWNFSVDGRDPQFRTVPLCLKQFAWAVPDPVLQQWDLARDLKDIAKDAKNSTVEYCIDAGDDLPPNYSPIYLLPLLKSPDTGSKTCLILRDCKEKVTEEAQNAVIERDRPHWMERTGIAIFSSSHFGDMQELPNQIIHLM